MGKFVVIRPEDDAAAEQASAWCSALVAELAARGHTLVEEVDELTPADTGSIEAALSAPATLVCYFGHGTPDSWQTNGETTIDKSNAGAAASKVVVSIACFTGRNLGPDAVNAGVTSWLGFTMKIPVIAPYKALDPVGEALVRGLEDLSTAGTIGDVRDSLITAFDELAVDYDDGGALAGHPAQPVGYYGALALKANVVVAGSKTAVPLP
jgi:hypothetical protein